MADPEKDEVRVLEHEFKWLLKVEVNASLQQLVSIMTECHRRFQMVSKDSDTFVKPEKFIMSTSSQSSTEQIKCIVTLTGDNITHADINLKIHKNTNQVYRTMILTDTPWKLQQIQDSGNHLQSALLLVSKLDQNHEFKSAEEVLNFITEIMGCLQRGLGSLVVPRKRTLDELQSSRNVKNLHPPLPPDVVVSFYIQSHKLMFAVYHILRHHGTTKFDVFQSECSVPWLNEAIVLFSMALQQCQQLKDKIGVFTDYKDMHI